MTIYQDFSFPKGTKFIGGRRDCLIEVYRPGEEMELMVPMGLTFEGQKEHMEWFDRVVKEQRKTEE